MDKKRFIFFALIICLLLAACSPSAPHLSPKFGLNPVLTLANEAPDLNKPVKLILTFTSVKPPGTENSKLGYHTRIILPPDMFELVEGNLESEWEMERAGEIRSTEVTIKSIKTGNAEIWGRVEMVIDGSASASEFDVMFVKITKDGATVSKTPPQSGFSLSCAQKEVR